MRKYSIFHHIIVILCTINICIDYENQPSIVRYVTDCIDFSFFCIYSLEMLFRYIIHRKYMKGEEYELDYKLDLALYILCCCGMTYELITSHTLL